MLREVSSRQMKLKKTKVPLTELRLRADAATKAYRVEQLKGARWALLSSFLIPLPDCKIGFQELKPPPEPETPEAPDVAKPASPKAPPSLKKKK